MHLLLLITLLSSTLQVRQKCLPVLRKFNFSWPAPLDCSRLPMPGDDAMCMEVPSINSSSSSSGSGSSNTATTSQHHPDPRPYPDHTRTPSQSLVRLDRWNIHALSIKEFNSTYSSQFLATHVIIISPFYQTLTLLIDLLYLYPLLKTLHLFR